MYHPKALFILGFLLTTAFSDASERKGPDPLSFIRLDGKKNRLFENVAYQRPVGELLAWFEEGENLAHTCDRTIDQLIYPSPWARAQAIRSFVATLQLITLERSIDALAAYARELSFNATEFEAFSDYLVESTCSGNFTLKSRRRMKLELQNAFEKSDFTIPRQRGNPLFSEVLISRYSQLEEKAKNREFYYSMELFKAACSWHNNEENFRLLTPLLSNPYLIAYVIRELTAQKLQWDENHNRTRLVSSDKKTTMVVCENLICRSSSKNDFLEKFPRALGTYSLQEDLERLYCEEIRLARYDHKDEEKQIHQWILDQSMEDQLFLQGQLLALLTGVPEYMLWNEEMLKTNNVLRANVDQTWNEWAKVANRGLAQNVFFEAPLRLERSQVPPLLSERNAPMGLSLDVNLGELDRSFERVGKLSVSYSLQMSEALFQWLGRQWRDHHQEDPQGELARRLVLHLRPQLERMKQHFALAPWDEGLEDLVAAEFLHQLSWKQSARPAPNTPGQVQIPIVLHYGPFALRYLAKKLPLRPYLK